MFSSQKCVHCVISSCRKFSVSFLSQILRTWLFLVHKYSVLFTEWFKHHEPFSVYKLHVWLGVIFVHGVYFRRWQGLTAHVPLDTKEEPVRMRLITALISPVVMEPPASQTLLSWIISASVAQVNFYQRQIRYFPIPGNIIYSIETPYLMFPHVI